MYCTLIKKVNVTKSEKLTQIATNKNTNFICIGGTNGFVQIVNLDVTKTKQDQAATAQQSQLNFTQTLQYHTDEITLIAWNEIYNKLSTCDKSGVIIVWKCVNNTWETEMINNRETSYVTDLKWSKQGHFLCFIYEDGHAIVGTVEGSRAWGNDIRNSWYLIEWSPDGTNLLLASKDNNVLVLSSSGQQWGELETDPSWKEVKIASMTWWTNWFSDNRSITWDKHLLLAYENGILMLYDNENDSDPWAIRTTFESLHKAEWNWTGDVIAMCGKMKTAENGVCFYSSEGHFIRIVKSPEPVLCFSWDANSTKIALETQNTIYYGLVKPNYKWCYFSDTLVYSFLSEQEHHTLIFWDIKANKHNCKYVKNMMDITAKTPFCLITASISDSNFLLILSNSIGSPVDNRIVNIKPLYLSWNQTHVVISDGDYVYIWQFRGSEGKEGNKSINIQGKEQNINLLTKKMMREMCFFVDDIPNMNDVYNYETFKHPKQAKDRICAIALTDNHLFITCTSGKAMKYNWLSLNTIEKFNFDAKMMKIGMSPSGQYLWGIEENNTWSIWDTEKQVKKKKGEKLKIEKKDVWNVIWSDQNDLTFAFLEKNRLNIIKNMEPEEVLTCNGYLADFSNWNITAVKLEDLMFKPWEKVHDVKDIVINVETRVLRDWRELLKEKISIDDIYHYVDEHSNRKLWEMLSNYAMNNLNFITAEKAMIHMNDYMGWEFIKRVKTIDDDNWKRAEIAQFFEDYDQSEDTYNDNDRKDLSIAMRLKLGNWDKVIALMKDNGVVQEDNMKLAYSNYADQFMEKKEYSKAEEYYKKANNIEGWINVWFVTEEFDKASDFIDKLPEQNELLLLMGSKFEMFGLCDEAVNCYIRYGDVKRAIDTCVWMNKWNIAVEWAEKNNFFQIEGLVNKFGSILIEKNKKMDLVEWYRKAHRHTDAAKIWIKIAEDLKELKAGPLTWKKIYVVAAWEMESFKSRLIDAQISNITQQTSLKNSTTWDTLVTSDLSNISDKTWNNPWKGAEAYHFYMWCQSQLYQNKKKDALKTALRWVLYEKELGAKEVYRWIAWSAFLNRAYKECSKAISKWENMASIPKNQKYQNKELAVAMFTMYDPKNWDERFTTCPNKKCEGKVSEYDIDCKNCGSNFSPCVLSGQSIFERDYFKCKRCKHKCLKSEVMKKLVKHCPLCHVVLDWGSSK